MADARPKRRCVASKQAVPSAVHYVGYVEDEETPEMIVRKFEELDRIQEAAVARRRPNDPDAERSAQPDQDPGGSDECAAGGSEDFAADAPGGDGLLDHGTERNGPLDDDELLEVFRQTSIFNVKSAMGNNEVLLAASAHPTAMGTLSDAECDAGLGLDSGGSDLDDDQLAYLKGFWSDGEVFEVPCRVKLKRGKRRQPRPEGAQRPERLPKAEKQLGANERHGNQQVLTHYHSNRGLHAALIRRKVSVGLAARSSLQAGQLTQIRVPPPPLPVPWGRTVEPYQPRQVPPVQNLEDPACCGAASAEDSKLFEVQDVAAFPWQKLTSSKEYQAVMVNSGWELAPGEAAAAGPTGEAAATSSAVADGPQATSRLMDRFRALPIPELCPKGFVLVWAHKGLISSICRQLDAWGYVYIENLTWVFLTASNTILRGQCPCTAAARSHRTLLIFRKEGEGRDIELRHQRSPDVIFDTERAADGRSWAVPNEVFTTIEVMLPTGKGAFLELWAARNTSRPGWDHVAERAAATTSKPVVPVAGANAVQPQDLLLAAAPAPAAQLCA